MRKSVQLSDEKISYSSGNQVKYIRVATFLSQDGIPSHKILFFGIVVPIILTAGFCMACSSFHHWESSILGPLVFFFIVSIVF